MIISKRQSLLRSYPSFSVFSSLFSFSFLSLVVFFSLFVFSQCYPSSSRARARTGDSTGGRRNKGINLARIRFALEAAGRALRRASRDFQVEPSPSSHDFPFFPRIAHFLSVTSTDDRFVIISRELSERVRFVSRGEDS